MVLLATSSGPLVDSNRHCPLHRLPRCSVPSLSRSCFVLGNELRLDVLTQRGERRPRRRHFLFFVLAHSHIIVIDTCRLLPWGWINVLRNTRRVSNRRCLRYLLCFSTLWSVLLPASEVVFGISVVLEFTNALVAIHVGDGFLEHAEL